MNWEFIILLPMILMAALYIRGLYRLRDRRVIRFLRGKMLTFAFGWLVLILALSSPMDRLSVVLFAAHMTQHQLMMMVAAPLLVLGTPLPIMWGVPPSLRNSAARWFRSRPYRRVRTRGTRLPAIAWIVFGMALWLWHVPVLYEAALRHEALHALQHTSFFYSALFFWWAIIRNARGSEAYGASVMYLFTTAMHSSALGVLLTFAPKVWYLSYNHSVFWGLSALQDQQLGGLIMWLPSGIIFTLAGLILFATWLRDSERLTVSAMARIVSN